MEFLANLLEASLLDPVVLICAVVAIAALLSGLVARVVQVVEDRTPVRAFDDVMSRPTDSTVAGCESGDRAVPGFDPS